MDRSNHHLRDEPEGGDITGADMIEEESEIVAFYKDKTVLITGATGYLGKLTLEKLLRVCEVKKIYLIVRTKKGKDSKTRFEEIFDDASFEPLTRKKPNYLSKVQMFSGDAASPNFGLSDEDIKIIKDEVDVVFHYAATVRFDEKLRTATYINVRAVRDLIRLAKDMKHLKAFVHISTAYANCIHQTIEEKMYEPPITAENLINIVDRLNDDQIDAITTGLIGKYPNTYTYTKCVAEHILESEGDKLPICLFRPSIVIGTVKEPVAGWINNVYGPTGVVLGAAIGLLRTLHGDPKNKADMVPADYVINAAIASAWELAHIRGVNKNKEVLDKDSREEKLCNEIPVYNFVCTPERPITWDKFQDISTKYLEQIPSEKCIWYRCFKMRKNEWAFNLSVLFLHTIPAYIVDFIARCLGKEPIMVKGYEKINKFSKVLAYFCQREWNFENFNTQALWNKLNRRDKYLFEFSMDLLDWEAFFYTLSRGGRLYVLKDPLETVPKGKMKYFKLRIAHNTLVIVLILIFIVFMLKLFNFVFY